MVTMHNASQTIPLDGCTRLTLDVSGADVAVRWVDGISAIALNSSDAIVDYAGDEVFIRADLRRQRAEAEPDEIRITDFESPGKAVEEILIRTGLFSGFRKGRKGRPLQVDLPLAIKTASLEVNNGDLQLGDPIGDVECKLKRGSFRSSGGEANLTITSGSGDVQVSRLTGAVRASGGSGNITILDSDAITNVKAGSGEISLKRVRGEAMKLAAGSGDIFVMDSQASAFSSECGSGDVEIKGGRLDRITVRTGSGDVDCSASYGPHTQSFTTGSGEVSLGIPREISARIEAFTSSGDIDSEAPLVSVGQRGPKSRRARRQVGSVGAGDTRAEIAVRTSSGDIRIHWLPTMSDAIPMPLRSPEPPAQPAPPVSPARPSSSEESSSAAVHSGDQRAAVLQALAHGEISVDEAEMLLSQIDAGETRDD